MKNAPDLLLQTIRQLIEENEIDAAFEHLGKMLDAFGLDSLQNDLALVRGNFKAAEKDFKIGILSVDYFNQARARARYALLELAKDVPKKLELKQKLENWDFGGITLDEKGLEKVIGNRENLFKISWLQQALQAARSVGRITVNTPRGQAFGTGFLVEGGYLFTNHHVLPDAEAAAQALVEFNFEEDSFGRILQSYTYRFDPSDFRSDEALDFARVKVDESSGEEPLSKWGFLEIDTQNIPQVNDPVTIIQHPQGGTKQIALTANEVISVWGYRLFYKADTKPGSSGSPVFNEDWKVVALHHAGKLLEDGGLPINEQGDRASANRGILFSFIQQALEG